MTPIVPSIVTPDEPILVTGATGFIGRRVVQRLVGRGLRVRCFVRPSSDRSALAALQRDFDPHGSGTIEIVSGNLLSPDDCVAAADGARIVIHLAAARGEKSVPDAFMNSVVTTRNLLEAARRHRCIRRFVSISSFTVYGRSRGRGRLLDETCPIETQPAKRGEAYCFAKVKQDEIVFEYAREHGIPYVVVRPGYVYGPGNLAISGRVGLGTFGVFLHMGGGNTVPLTYVDNCAEAIVRAAITDGVDGEVFNVVDDELPTSRRFLRQYKRHVRRFRSIYVPHAVSYALCWLWESYSRRSQGQLPPSFNRLTWHAYWKQTRYSNEKLKTKLGWRPEVSTADALARYFEACREKRQHA
jgi:nucleoside-diphosphate-sugar epimerase